MCLQIPMKSYSVELGCDKSFHPVLRIRLHTYNSPVLSKHWLCLYNMRKIHGDGFWWSLSLFILFMQDFWAEIRKTWTFSFLQTDINSNNISEMVWSILSNNVNLHWKQIYLLDQWEIPDKWKIWYTPSLIAWDKCVIFTVFWQSMIYRDKLWRIA